MVQLHLNDLITGVNVRKLIGDSDVQITGIRFDSRKVVPGELFVATRGTAADGHDFIPAAIEKGAVAVVCETLPADPVAGVCYVVVENSAAALGLLAAAWYDFPSSKMTVVGVTGTNGKTTIATLLYRLFKMRGYKTGLLSTVANYIDNLAVEATHTTPDAMSIQELLYQMAIEGCQYVFMEVSSHAVVQERIAGVDFDGGVFTNLTRDHIDYHETFANYLQAKKRFFDGLSVDSFALTNLDDKNGKVMLQNTKASKHTYSLRGLADFKTKILEHDFTGMLLDVNEQEMHVPFIGRFNASNLTAVYGTAVLLGVDPLEALRIISALKPVEGRFDTLRAPAGYTAIVDYAHTPDALTNVISTINQILQGSGRLITVIGCGGNRDKGKRPMMAKEAVVGSWKAVFTADNPRFEDPEMILDDMVAGLDVAQRAQCLRIVDRREAIKTACALAQAGDVVLVAGKGHETYQIIQGVKQHFDDKEEVRACFV